MPMGVMLPRQSGSEQAVMERPQQFVVGEGLGTQGVEHDHAKEHWQVDCFLKSGGHLFYVSTDPKVGLEWIDKA